MSRLTVGFLILMVVAACAGPGSTTTPTGTAAPTGTAGPATAALGETTLGKVLVGPNGKTLYGFVPDVAAAKPTCYDSCATTWPPLTITGDFSVGAGLDKSKFKTVARTDGTTQLQIGDYPLYYYAPDVNPGDTTGQGVGGNWFVVGADGQLIGAAA